MGSVRITGILTLIMICLSACSTTRYTWNHYDDKLYQHYKNPAENEKFIEGLKVTIEDGEKTGTVPPGIYAEYGYTFYETGNYSEAAEYFQKEYDKWPESRVFMSKMINNAKKLENKYPNK